VSDRALKVITTSLLVGGILLMFLWPVLLQSPGAAATNLAKQRFLIKYMLYMAGLIAIFISTAVCAWVLLKRSTRALDEKRDENFRRMVEGAVEDQRNRNA
jgi:hypothetical protein